MGDERVIITDVRPEKCKDDSRQVKRLLRRHLPWVNKEEIRNWLLRKNYNEKVAEELSGEIAEVYNGAFKKGLEVGFEEAI